MKWLTLTAVGVSIMATLPGCSTPHKQAPLPGDTPTPSLAAEEAGVFQLTSGLYAHTNSGPRGIDKSEMRLVREGNSVRIVEYDFEWPAKGRLDGNSFTLRAASDKGYVRLEGKLTADNVLEGTCVVTYRDGKPARESKFRLENTGPVTAPWRRPPSRYAP